MRGSKAKKIRRMVYARHGYCDTILGMLFDPRRKTYKINVKTGQVLADPGRAVYQHAKKHFRGQELPA